MDQDGKDRPKDGDDQVKHSMFAPGRVVVQGRFVSKGSVRLELFGKDEVSEGKAIIVSH